MPPVAAIPVNQPNGQTARASNARPYNQIGKLRQPHDSPAGWGHPALRGNSIIISRVIKTCRPAGGTPYFLSIISYLLSKKIPLFSTSENRGIFYSSTSFTSGSPKANARAFSIVVMAMLCIAVRVKNAW